MKLTDLFTTDRIVADQDNAVLELNKDLSFVTTDIALVTDNAFGHSYRLITC